jgi:hypothetical protein
MFCAGCDDRTLAALKRNVPPMPATCVTPTPAPDLPSGVRWKRLAFEYIAAFKKVNREKVECGRYADGILSDLRNGKR